jgi:GDP-L-fucose synthase
MGDIDARKEETISRERELQDTKIFVAGGKGLVGSAILRELKRRGYPEILAPSHQELDLSRQELTEKFFQETKPNWVFLCASRVGGILANNTYRGEFIYENLAIALHTIHSAYKAGVGKLLNFASSCIYPRNCSQPMKESYLLTGSLEPTNEPYAMAKIAGVKLVRYYNEQYGTNYFTVMPTNLYGPGDNFNLETSHVLPALIRKFHLGKLLQEGDFARIRKDFHRFPIGFGFHSPPEKEKEIVQILETLGIQKNSVTLWGTGNVFREFLYVDDLAEICLHLMESVSSEEVRTWNPDYLINLGSGQDQTIREVAEMVKEVIGYTGEIRYDPSKPDGTPRKLLDISFLNHLGIKPRTTLFEGIKKTYQWYLQTVERTPFPS